MANQQLVCTLLFALTSFPSEVLAIDAPPGGEGPDLERLVVVVPRALAEDCYGCSASEASLLDGAGQPLPNDQVLECPNGVTGATIVVSDATATGGTCRMRNITPFDCVIEGVCKYSVSVEIVFAPNSCHTSPIWVTGPGLPSAQPLVGTWDYGTLSGEAPCKSTEQHGQPVKIRVTSDQAGILQIGIYGFRVKCTACEKR
ncbi:MAG: hypothetical protein IPK26_20860 [Planctomycetes bacterium]|nr:hypothetical protein [Planctomycetota bacterium]